MTSGQFQADLAAAALRMSRSTPGVSLDVIRDAMIVGSDLGMAFVSEFWRAQHAELDAQRKTTNLPN